MMKQPRTWEKSKLNSGVAAVEFLFAAPAFFILVFFVVEIALVWNDRHIMRLSAYRAARSVVKTRAGALASSPLCWKSPVSGAPIDATDQAVQTAARRASAKVMATITPSMEQLTEILDIAKIGGTSAGITFSNTVRQAVNDSFGTATEMVNSSSYVHALYRMISGLPGAWIFTEISCQDVTYGATASSNETRGVEIKLVYNRPAKMPYIGTIMWTLRKLQELGQSIGFQDDGTNGVIRFDPLNYGLGFDIRANRTQTDLALQKLKDMVVDKARDLGQLSQQKLAEKGYDMFPSGGTGGILPDIFGSTAGLAFDEGVKALGQFDVARMINWVGNMGVEIVLEAPGIVKTIPITVTVRIPHYGQSYKNQGQPWDGVAFLVGNLSDESQSKFAKLARKMGEMMTVLDPPNDQQGLPYVDIDK
jgi:Flp pilus assembly protein TadG